MTPKEKAKELYVKYAVMWHASTKDVKECALIAVNEIISIKLLWYQKDTKELDYWNDVKKEIDGI